MQPSLGIKRKYLQLEDLQRLKSFQFSPRRLLDGMYTGRHATPQRGHSVEFRDFRQYIPGDDISNVDWKVYGRTDKMYVKIYENETELTITLLIDASASMAYRGADTTSKYDLACRLAAALSLMVLSQQDRVALGMALRGLCNYRSPAGSLAQLEEMLDRMERTVPTGEAHLAKAVQQAAARIKRGQILIVLSDLWEDRAEIIQAVSQVIHRGGEAILFHVLHEDELRLPPLENAVFVDSETSETVRLSTGDIVTAYDRALQEHLRLWEATARQADVDYHLASTSMPYHHVLERYLSRRAVAV